MDTALSSTKFNPLFMMLDSGARGNPQNVRQIAGMKGLVTNPKGEMIPKWSDITDSDQKTWGWIYKIDTQEVVACSKELDGRKRPYIEY